MLDTELQDFKSFKVLKHVLDLHFICRPATLRNPEDQADSCSRGHGDSNGLQFDFFILSAISNRQLEIKMKGSDFEL